MIIIYDKNIKNINKVSRRKEKHMSERQPASTMNYKEVLAELEEVYQNAKPYMSPKCRVCKVCNSLNCRMIPTERGLGGAQL